MKTKRKKNKKNTFCIELKNESCLNLFEIFTHGSDNIITSIKISAFSNRFIFVDCFDC